jgi:hypothetical protein
MRLRSQRDNAHSGAAEIIRASRETIQDIAHKRATVEKILRRRLDRAIETGELPDDASSENLTRFICDYDSEHGVASPVWRPARRIAPRRGT